MTHDNRNIHQRVAQTPDESLLDESGYDDSDAQPTITDVRVAELRRARRIIYFLTNAAAVVILLRFLLMALGANLENPFAQLVLGVSLPLVYPFQNLFGAPMKLGGPDGNMLIDFSYIVAIGMYYLLAMGVIKLISLYYTRYTN